MTTALFVDPSPSEYANVVEAATFVVETAVSIGEPLLLACSASVALDIGVAIFGRGAARTVEGGERRPSPIVLLPLIRDSDSSMDEPLRPDVEHGSPGTLADLIDLGVMTSRQEREIDPFGGQNPIEAFVQALRREEASTVFGFGQHSPFWRPTLDQLRETPQIRLVVLRDFAPEELPLDQPTIIRIDPSGIPERPARRERDGERPDDEFEQSVVRARQQAARTAALMDSVLRRRER